MPDTSALCFSTFSSILPSKEPIPSSSFASFSFLPLLKCPGQPPIRSVRFTAKASGSSHFLGDDAFGNYPWEPSDPSDSFGSFRLMNYDDHCVIALIAALAVAIWVDETYRNFVIIGLIPYCNYALIVEGGDTVARFSFEPHGNPAVQWVQEDKVTLFTADGLIQIGGSLVPQRVSSSDKKQGKVKMSPRLQRYQESDYMDPDQVLCLGALFDIAATNGLDMGRKLCILGFCRSVEMLSDVVEDIVVEHGGEVVSAEKASKGGMHEKLTMTVSVPLLWGIPPASETLHLAVRSGGGIVEKVYWRWDFLSGVRGRLLDHNLLSGFKLAPNIEDTRNSSIFVTDSYILLPHFNRKKTFFHHGL
nr:uncharacterized protein LOC109181692 [Ipomoea batatas]